jgi:hypothetical protein
VTDGLGNVIGSTERAPTNPRRLGEEIETAIRETRAERACGAGYFFVERSLEMLVPSSFNTFESLTSHIHFDPALTSRSKPDAIGQANAIMAAALAYSREGDDSGWSVGLKRLVVEVWSKVVQGE